MSEKKNSKTTATPTTEAPLLIHPIDRKIVGFTIKQRGTSPLVQHSWSEKALLMLRLSAAERKKVAKTARDPEAEGKACMYLTSDGGAGVPAMAIKSSLLRAAHKDYGIPRTSVMKAIFLRCPDESLNLPLDYDSVTIREDCVRVGVGQTDLRYRPEFRGWRVRVEFELDARMMNAQDLINLANNAGFGVGIGEWRPEKGGEWGRYEVDTTEPVTVS